LDRLRAARLGELAAGGPRDRLQRLRVGLPEWAPVAARAAGEAAAEGAPLGAERDRVDRDPGGLRERGALERRQDAAVLPPVGEEEDGHETARRRRRPGRGDRPLPRHRLATELD